VFGRGASARLDVRSPARTESPMPSPEKDYAAEQPSLAANMSQLFLFGWICGSDNSLFAISCVDESGDIVQPRAQRRPQSR
jgi:hypothetical protein